VPQTIADELSRADEAFSGNRLLSTFAADARGFIEPSGVMVELAPGEIVLERGDPAPAQPSRPTAR